jgi:uncharacterized protein
MELAQAKTPGRQVIESYGAGRFRVSGTVHEGSVIVFPDRTEPWRIAAFDQIDQGSFAGITAADVDLLLAAHVPRTAFHPPAITHGRRRPGADGDRGGVPHVQCADGRGAAGGRGPDRGGVRQTAQANALKVISVNVSLMPGSV